MNRIALVEDHERLAELVRTALAAAGIETDCFYRLEPAWHAVQQMPYGMLVVDRGLPDGDGLRLVQRLRAAGLATPCLMLTARDAVHDRVEGLESGADDYLAKPFPMEELVARVRALLRRAALPPRPPNAKPLRFGPLTVDLERKTANRDGVPLRLTRTEYALLTVLRENAGRPVSREMLLDHVWGGPAKNSHALDTHLWRLRRKLGDTGEEAQWIRNLPGIGYVLSAEVVEPRTE